MICKFYLYDIIVDSERYVVTRGLWRLLSYKDAPEEKYYSQEDLNNYVMILFDTSSVYKNNDRSTAKPKSSRRDKSKSSRGDKYMNLIANIWKMRKDIEGSGFEEYKENVEYKYIV